MKWSTSDIPSQLGKIIVITGANAGIGYETARVLAGNGAAVVLAVRSLSKGEAAAAAIRADYPSATLHVMELDLSDLSSVRRFSELFVSDFSGLDILINNAGQYSAQTHTVSKDGFALTMAVNHIGHFALTGLLLDHMLATPGSRIVTLSSGVHSSGKIDPASFETTEANAKGAYANSKLANMLFALELHRRLEIVGAEVTSVSAGPGATKSDAAQQGVASISNPILRWTANKITDVLMNPVSIGALPVLRAATDPHIHSGSYITPQGFMSMRGAPVEKAPSLPLDSKALAKTLWKRSIELTGVNFSRLRL